MISKITREELKVFNELIEMEQIMLNKILSSNENIHRAYYTGEMIVLQFKSGKEIDSKYLETLKDLIDYKNYSIEIATITEEIFKIKYKEQVLQLNIYL